ncbi:MAG: anaerobic ribonucleoside-triphosphate reductase activating protein [Clostridia bacterium]|nr:anaerobic ribonucleoside-triphosphate reductase activating protein [Clostridia bacterium]
MNYSSIKNCDIANGEGVRVSLFVSGCRNCCKECFNKETWDFCYGEPFTQEVEEQILNLLKPSYIKGLTILGGEPFEPENQEQLIKLCEKVKREYPTKDIWCFTGFTLDNEILGESRASGINARTLLSYIDILVDGRFVNELKNISLKFRGSSNQRIIDVKKTLKEGKIILSPLNN